ncbi:alpha/beta hydrolase [Nocardia macrotermitis]|uniref:alpha/beta hydrolase n=1 Tax=Nocardia macrotermitis TaxID=2585198 RepID=UPI0029E7D5EE|nr:alpha/beta hydrolase [Nocardia macrotermitis]
MIALSCALAGVARADTGPAPCRSFSIAIPQGRLGATLCAPASATTVLVLMAGSNYNGTYWDFAYQPQIYNFREAMNRAGYATLVVDRLGNGSSSHPPALTLNAANTSEPLHDIVRSLRHGLAGAAPFARVVTAGHSLSSGTSVMEASKYHDVDAVVLTGYSHALNVAETLGVISTYHRAVDDPVFAGSGLDAGYLTTRPGTRMHDFFAPGDADPAVVARDERTKEVFSLTEYPDSLLSTLPGMSSEIDVPVLIVDGSLDRLSCGAGYSACTSSATLRAEEAPYFAPAARLQTFVLPGSGHSVNLARNTGMYQNVVLSWLNSTVGH